MAETKQEAPVGSTMHDENDASFNSILAKNLTNSGAPTVVAFRRFTGPLTKQN
jgi:hypothetical protein